MAETKTRSRRRFGRVEHLNSGRWRARYQALDGTVASAPTTFRTKTDANSWLIQVEADLARGVHVDHRAGRTPLGEVAEHWMGLNEHRLRPKTVASYRSLLDAVILPMWSSVGVGKIRTTGVREWVAGLSERGLSPSRVRQACGLLSRVLADAAADGLLAGNPCQGVKLPRLPRRELHYLTPTQVEALADHAPAPYDLLVYVLAYGGLRFGEAAALRRSRCELLRSRLHVVEAVSEANGRLHLGGTKSHAHRAVVVPKFLNEALAAHLAALPRSGDPLLFPAPDGGLLRYSNFYRRVWCSTVAAAGLDELGFRVTPHLLRHTCATLLIGCGATPRDVADHLGHANPSITLDVYAAAFDGHADELAVRLDDLRRQAQRGA